jgi:hypothetical protein
VKPNSSSPYRLTVEGSDDLHTIIHLMAKHGYRWDDDAVERPHVHAAGGLTLVLDSIGLAAKTYQRAGIVIDVDEDFSARWDAVSGRLKLAGYSVPDVPPHGGLVLEHVGLARFGVWMMPDNKAPGRLEEFLEAMVDAGDPTWSNAQHSTAAAMAAGAKLRTVERLKGTLHAWLSWHDPPGMALGTAVKARIFAHDHHLAQRFAAWFRTLFG